MGAAISGLQGMEGIHSDLLDALLDDTPLHATVPESREEARSKDEPGILPVTVGNRLKNEVEGVAPENLEDQVRAIGKPNKIATVVFSGHNSPVDPVYFLAFPTGRDQRGLSEPFPPNALTLHVTDNPRSCRHFSLQKVLEQVQESHRHRLLPDFNAMHDFSLFNSSNLGLKPSSP